MFRSGILPKLTVDILESRVGNTGDTRSPMRFSLDDINLERKRNTPVGAVTGTQDDINSPRFHSGPRQWDSPSNMDMAEGNVRFDDCVNDLDNARTIDMRKHASRKKKTKKEKDDDNGNIYDVDIEIDDDVGAVQNMAIDDYEYGSVLAAMEEVLKLPQKYSGDIICSDIDDWSGEGTCGPVFEDGDEFEETAQDRMFVDCVIDGEDGHESDASSGESSSDSVSGCSHPSDYRDGSGSKDNEDDELLNNDGDGPLQEDKDAVTARVDNLRQYLESCVGPVNFVKAYSLLRVVESSDDDDALLHEMESIVGVEGLFLMDSFIKLISLEDEIIDQYGD
ncbi:unnamed protein product [Symbiodinium microadriaticum]|nr:unnamed protein product [Symbiodinium microadriaticum]